MTPTSTDTRDTGTFRPAVGVIVVGLLIVLTLLIGLVWYVGLRESGESPPEASGGIAPARILDDPEAFRGQRVSVVSTVDEIVPPAGFALDGGLLVVGLPPAEVQQAIDAGWTAVTHGTVRPYDEGVIRAKVGQPVSNEVTEAYERQPMLMLDRFEIGGRDAG